MTTPTIVHFARKSRRQSILWLAAGCLLWLIIARPGFPARTIAQDAVAPQAPHSSRLQAKRRQEMRQRKIDNPEAEDGANVYRHSPMVHSLARSLHLSVEATSRMFESINFLLLVIAIVWVIKRLLPRLFPQATFRARTERIRNEIEQAHIATEDANRRLARVEERLARLDSDIDAIRLKADRETSSEEERLREAMEQEKQAILESAKQDITAATKNAQGQLKRMAADLAIEHARRRISLSPANDHNLVEEFLTDLDQKHPGGAVN